MVNYCIVKHNDNLFAVMSEESYFCWERLQNVRRKYHIETFTDEAQAEAFVQTLQGNS